MNFGILDGNYTPDIELNIVGDTGKIYTYPAISEEDLPDQIADLDAAMVWHYINVSKKTLDRLARCKAIVRIGVGFDSVDGEYAGKLGIPLINIPDYGTNDVADHCLSLLLSGCRSLPLYSSYLDKDLLNNWIPERGGNIKRLQGSKLGIVGMGRIGSAVASRAKSFGINVSFFDPYLPDGYDKTYQINRFYSLQDLFSDSDYISIHAPLTNETRGMIDKTLLESAKNGLILINTARGGIVNLEDVYASLKSDKIKFFGADVLECEPPTTDYALIKSLVNRERWLDGRVLLTPHAAFYAEESRIEMRTKAAEQMKNVALNVPLRNCVNKEYLVNPRTAISDY